MSAENIAAFFKQKTADEIVDCDWSSDVCSSDLEQIKFTLAAYNAGLGHVLDAIRLAELYGKNPKVWDNNVDYFMLHKSQPEIYRDSVVRFGYCDGKQTFNFVNNIMENYTHYKNTIKK